MNIIKEFEKIRDVPYRIPLSDSEVDNSCSGKSFRLKKILEKFGYPTRFQVCEFRWSDLHLPQELLLVPHSDISTHVYVETKVDDS